MPERPVEFIGMIGTNNGSETRPAPAGPGVIDKSFVAATARAHEFSGFDRVLIGYFSNAPDGFQVAAFAAHETDRLGLLLAHRPGFVAPTLAARQLASLDQFSDGRLAVHMITGGSDADQARDGDFLGQVRALRPHRRLHRCPQEDLDQPPGRSTTTARTIRLRIPSPRCAACSSRISRSTSGARRTRPSRWRASTPTSTPSGARASRPSPRPWRRVRAAAARHGREDRIRFSLSLRPILGHTEDEAWTRAAPHPRDRQVPCVAERRPHEPQNAGSQRLLAEAARGAVVDKRLWTELAALTGAQGNSTSLVGTPQQVAEAMLAYWDLGVTTFLIRGFDPLEDAIEYGRDLIPLVREATAARSKSRLEARA